MKDYYIFEYLNENNFKKLERSVKKYNPLAYKKMLFDYYPALKEGKFLGKLISVDSKKKTSSYLLKLPTDSIFAKVHGEMILYYTVYLNKKIILLEKIMPENILAEGHMSELSTYKGVMISKRNADKDIFKINLFKILGE